MGSAIARRAAPLILASALAASGCATTRPIAGPVDVDPGGPPTEPAPPAVAVLRLANQRAACVASGTDGKLVFAEGDVVLAELAPSERAEVELPLGRHVLSISDGATRSTRTLEIGPDGALAAETCPVPVVSDRFHGPALVPLTLIGPEATCPAEAAIKARAGGLVIELDPGERTILYLPRGSHVVRTYAPRDPATGASAPSSSTTVDLGEAGAELVLGSCATSQGVVGRE